MRSEGDERRSAIVVLCTKARAHPEFAQGSMKTSPSITSPYAPDLEQVRTWLEKMIAALRFAELVASIVAFIARMVVINAELTKQLAHLRCWSHGRRRLAEAARSGDRIALEGLRLIAPLFAVERASTLAGDTAELRRARRDQHTRPILDVLRGWLDDRRATIPPKTPLGQALGYLHRQWHRLLLFLEDGNIEATNNRRERELRRLVLGRRNWLFAWKDEGGERTATILTIIGTAIAHDINPRAYLHLVTKLIVHGWPQAHARDLLPDRILAAHPELYVGDPALSPAVAPLALSS